MNLYQQIKDIFPYLVSIRKLEGYVSIDIEFPATWKFPKKYVDERMVLEQKSQNTNKRFFSFASEFEEKILGELFKNLLMIIRYNLEREEKEKLFEMKVQELKQFFDQTKLDDLKSLEFNVNHEYIIPVEDGQGSEDIKLVS